MGEVNYEKGENHYFFHTTTPCATSNLLPLVDQPNALNPIKTQFVTNFLMVEFGWIVVQVKTTIEQTIVNPNKITFVNMLHGTQCQKSLTKAKVVWAKILKRDEFWDTCANFVHMVESILYQRWVMLKTNLHYARAFFNPYLLGEVCLHDDANVKEVWDGLFKILKNAIFQKIHMNMKIDDLFELSLRKL